VFITTCWKNILPLVSLKTLSRVGSGQTPLVFDTGATTTPTIKQFHFEKGWLQVDGFKHLVPRTWNLELALQLIQRHRYVAIQKDKS
jgi:hypothetical protein